MPICTAVLAAALLSGPADPTPQSAKEPMAPGKKIAALAMNHPEEPDFVASKALEILNKGTNVGPFNMDDENERAGSRPMASGESRDGQSASRQAPSGQSVSRQAPTGRAAAGERASGPSGNGPYGNAPGMGSQSGSRPASDDQANSSQPPGFMFTMPATSKNRSPQDIFLHPTGNQPTYTKLSGSDFTRQPSSREDDDEFAGAWAWPLQGKGVAKAAKSKAAKPKAAKSTSKASADDFWNIPGWD